MTSPQGSPRRKRRYSPWTLLAPVALVVLVIAIFNALGSTCLLSSCTEDKKDVASPPSAPVGLGKRHYVVRKGDSADSISKKFSLTVQGFSKCNPNISDIYVLHTGETVNVGPTCRKLSKQLGESPVS